MNKKLQKIILIAGIVIFIAAISVFAYIKIAANARVGDTAKTVEFMESVIPERTAGFKDDRANTLMPSTSYNGTDYSLILEIPAHSAKLPVANLWDSRLANYVPCRFDGSIYDGSIIIGGADKDGQLDFISDIDISESLTLTDLKGAEFHYRVATVKHAKDAKAETLKDEKYDFTLFAKAKKSRDYILVRCTME